MDYIVCILSVTLYLTVCEMIARYNDRRLAKYKPPNGYILDWQKAIKEKNTSKILNGKFNIKIKEE